MSWASHNPQLYDEMCKKGISRKLVKELGRYGFDDFESFTLDAIIDVLYEQPDILRGLISWAVEEISEQETDYFSGLIDKE